MIGQALGRQPIGRFHGMKKGFRPIGTREIAGVQRSTHSLTYDCNRGLSDAVAVWVRSTRRQNPNPVLSGISPNFRKLATLITSVHTDRGNVVDGDVRMGPSTCLAEGKKVLERVVFGFHEADHAKA